MNFDTVMMPAAVPLIRPAPHVNLARAVECFRADGYELGLTGGGALCIRRDSSWHTPAKLELGSWLFQHLKALGLSHEFSAELCDRFELSCRVSADQRPATIK